MHMLPVFLLLITVATPVLAYVGPGPGLSMIGSFFALIASIAVALFFVIAYPIRQLIKKNKHKSDASSNDVK